MKTAVAAAALVASVSAYNSTSLPSCWTSCFEQYDLSDESCLCDQTTGKSVDACIASGCDSSDASAYQYWLSSYCSSISAVPSGAASSSYPASYPASSSYYVPSSSYPEYPQSSSYYVPSSSYPAYYQSSSYPAGYSGSWPASTGLPTPSAYPASSESESWTDPTTTSLREHHPATSTVYSTATTCACETHSPGETWTTTVTESISVIPHEKSYSWGGWSSVYTSYESSTVTGTWTVTNTEPTAPASASLSLYPSKTCTTGPSVPSPSASSCVPCQGQGSGAYCGLDLQTDWYSEAPNTCNVVTYDWTVTQGTVAPDGVERMGFLINNQFPGPMIHANWGDTVVVKVTNNLPADVLNGTTIHFHGIRQNGTNEYDGVSSITQCPLAPGDSMTYVWRATSYGTSWWHAHYSLQLYDGLFGPIVIEGPATAEYDDDQVIILQDWNHVPVDALLDNSEIVVAGVQGESPVLDTGLINGQNVWEGSGQYYSMTVQAGKSYRLRLINTAMQSLFKFHIDSHSFTVIAMDFVPIQPYETDIVSINIGQRYDLILKADQAPANYWMRSDNQQVCTTELANPYIQGILNYEGVALADPTTTALTYEPNCLDEPASSLVPYLALNAGADPTAGALFEEVVIAGDGATPNLYKWTLSGSTFLANWNDPTLYSIWYNDTVPAYGGDLTVELPNAGEWVYFIIDSPIPLPHPIHQHGQDFYVLAAGVGTYNDSVALNLNNPPRRDTATMPADPTTGLGGYLVIAYPVSNPGVWLLHCHIGWHNTMGFALQVVEMLEDIQIANSCQMEEVCENWLAYAEPLNLHNAPWEDGT